jgi:transposase
MDRYIGIDSHAQSCTLGVLGPSGKRLKSMVVETNGQVLIDAIKSIPQPRHICLEEGTQSAWLYELLSPYARDVAVIVPLEKKGSKDDLRDAWNLAERLRMGGEEFRRVYKTPQALAALRNAVRAHTFAVRDVVRAKNRLKAIFLSRGISVDASVYDPDQRTKLLTNLPKPHRPLAEWLGRMLDELVPFRAEADEWLKKESKSHPVIRQLSTAPGMGPIRSAIVVSVVADPSRFRTRQPFWSYCGLAVINHTSGNWSKKRGKLVRVETTSTRGLSRRRNSQLKGVFKGTATSVIHQLPDDPLHRNYQRLLKAGMKANLAKLTLARQIAATVLSMWKHGEVYDPERRKVVTDQT